MCDPHSHELCPQRVLVLRALRKARVFQKLLGSEGAGSIRLVLRAYLHRILPGKLLLNLQGPTQMSPPSCSFGSHVLNFDTLFGLPRLHVTELFAESQPVSAQYILERP